MNLEYKNISEKDLRAVATKVKEVIDDFFSKNKRSCIVFLNGGLGAGKTTFTKSLGKIIGLNEEIISPTFILRKDYENMIHVDGYRFESEEEGKSIALEKELDDVGKIILIEWPEKFVKALNIDPDISIDFIHVNEEKRDIFIKTH